MTNDVYDIIEFPEQDTFNEDDMSIIHDDYEDGDMDGI